MSRSRTCSPRRSEAFDDPAVADDGRPDRRPPAAKRPRPRAALGHRAALRRRGGRVRQDRRRRGRRRGESAGRPGGLSLAGMVGRCRRRGPRERRPDADLRPRQDRTRRRALRQAVADACGYADGLARELVAEAIRRFAVADGLLPGVDQDPPPPEKLSARQIGFLRAFDVDYEGRRLAFARDGVAWSCTGALTRSRVSTARRSTWRSGLRLSRGFVRSGHRRRRGAAAAQALRADCAGGRVPRAGGTAEGGACRVPRRVQQPLRRDRGSGKLS